MGNDSERDDAEEMDDLVRDELEMYDHFMETDNPPINLLYFVTVSIDDTPEKNAKFIETKFPEISRALTSIHYALLLEDIVDCGETLSSMLSDIAHPQFISLINDLLFGNLPGCYVSIRGILETVVDSVVAPMKFPDHPFPDDLEMLRQLERKHHITFKKKCVRLLPKQVDRKTRDNIYGLYDYLSSHWVHPKGVAKSLKDDKGHSPGWAIILPNNYGDTDIAELREFVQKLQKLEEYIHAILQPAIEYFKTQAPNSA